MSAEYVNARTAPGSGDEDSDVEHRVGAKVGAKAKKADTKVRAKDKDANQDRDKDKDSEKDFEPLGLDFSMSGALPTNPKKVTIIEPPLTPPRSNSAPAPQDQLPKPILRTQQTRTPMQAGPGWEQPQVHQYDPPRPNTHPPAYPVRQEPAAGYRGPLGDDYGRAPRIESIQPQGQPQVVKIAPPADTKEPKAKHAYKDSGVGSYRSSGESSRSFKIVVPSSPGGANTKYREHQRRDPSQVPPSPRRTNTAPVDATSQKQAAAGDAGPSRAEVIERRLQEVEAELENAKVSLAREQYRAKLQDEIHRLRQRRDEMHRREIAEEAFKAGQEARQREALRREPPVIEQPPPGREGRALTDKGDNRSRRESMSRDDTRFKEHIRVQRDINREGRSSSRYPEERRHRRSSSSGGAHDRDAPLRSPRGQGPPPSGKRWSGLFTGESRTQRRPESRERRPRTESRDRSRNSDEDSVYDRPI